MLLVNTASSDIGVPRALSEEAVALERTSLPSRAIATTAPGTVLSPISRAKKPSKCARRVVDGIGVAWAGRDLSPAARTAMVAAEGIGAPSSQAGPQHVRPRHGAMRQREA